MMMTMLIFLVVMSLMSQKLISMGGILLFSALIFTIFTSFLTNSWYGFILFLIYITGLLVLFGYFLAMTPNSHQSAKYNFKIYLAVCVFLSFMSYSYIIKQPMNKNMYTSDVTQLLNNLNTPMYLLMALILLLALFMVVSLTYKAPSPLRNYL